MSITPKLNRFDATVIVVSLVVGIGIFRTPAIVASHTGSATLFFGAWILGGVISVLGALTFAEIGSRYPYPGAFYKVVADCYSPSIAFMLNWTNVVIVNGAGAAAVATIGAEYLLPMVSPAASSDPRNTQLAAAALVLLLLGINYLGVKTGAWAQNVLTIFKILVMLTVVVAAMSIGRASQCGVPLSAPGAGSAWQALGLGLISVFYSYGGYQSALNFGGDFRAAGRTMPRAILAGIAVVIVVYLLVNLAYYRVLGLEGIAGAKLVAAEIAGALAGPSGSTIVSAVIVLSAMGFLNVTLMQIPRTYVAMAEQRTLPAVFARVHPRTQVQTFGLAFFGAMIFLAIAFLGTFEKLLNYVMLFDTLNNALVASTVFILRRRRVTAEGVEPYTVPWYPVVPAVFVLFLVFITANVVLDQGVETLAGVAMMLAGYPAYRLLRAAVERT